MAGRSSIISLRKRFEVPIRKQEGIISYDKDNAYPQRVFDIIRGSSVAVKATDVYAKFIMGNGFTDQTFYKSVINSNGETVDSLYRKNVKDFSRLKSFALHVNFDANGAITELTHIPIEYFRFVAPADEFSEPTKCAIYPDWGLVKGRIKKDKIETYDLFGTVDVTTLPLDEFTNYKGQVFYYSPYGLCYPEAVLDSALEDCVTDNEIKVFKWREVTTGYMASLIYIDRTRTEDTMPNPMAEVLANFQGGDNAGKIMHIESQDESTDPKILPVNMQNVDKQFEWTEQSTQDNIRFAVGLPSVLLGKEVAGKLGTSSEVVEATQYFNNQTSDERLIFEECYKILCSRFATNINPSGDYSIIPITYTSDSGKEVLANSIGVGGVQSFTAILADPNITQEQKRQSLILLFGIDEETAQKLIYGTINA